MRGRPYFWLVTLCLCAVLGACGTANDQAAAQEGVARTDKGTPAEQDLVASAAAQATAIVQQAQATALVLQAEAQATALVLQAVATAPPPGEAPTPAAIAYPTRVARAGTTESSSDPAPRPSPSPVDEPLAVEVVSVGFAGDGGMIIVRFLAPPEEAEKWWQGSASVTDEGNGAVYDEIPVMPRIGPLIGRPKVAGQLGYVMLMNAPPGLQPGALVTVVLGAHRFEHVAVE